jgi:hypothetical protein
VGSYWREANNIATRMRKWRLICHTLRKGDGSIEKQALVWSPQESRRRGVAEAIWKKTVSEEARKMRQNMQ